MPAEARGWTQCRDHLPSGRGRNEAAKPRQAGAGLLPQFYVRTLVHLLCAGEKTV